jgi:hypothetical protein
MESASKENVYVNQVGEEKTALLNFVLTTAVTMVNVSTESVNAKSASKERTVEYHIVLITVPTMASV